MSTKDDVKTDPALNGEQASDGFIVTDPEILRPKVLPLVITLPEGQSWKNPEQADYAKILNAAAYCNSESWNRLQKGPDGKDMPNSAIKDVELKRLAEIGSDPSRYYFYTGTQQGDPGKLGFNNKLINQ